MIYRTGTSVFWVNTICFHCSGRHHTCPCPSRRRCGQGEPRGDVQEEAVQEREEGTEEEGEREEDHRGWQRRRTAVHGYAGDKVHSQHLQPRGCDEAPAATEGGEETPAVPRTGRPRSVLQTAAYNCVLQTT